MKTILTFTHLAEGGHEEHGNEAEHVAESHKNEAKLGEEDHETEEVAVEINENDCSTYESVTYVTAIKAILWYY